MPQGDTVCAGHAAALTHGTRCLRKQGNFQCNRHATLTQFSPLHAPLFPLSSHPHDTLHWFKPLPNFKSKFPFAARSAECCCLLCTQKFAEAVSCPQTSAPWSGAGEERQGLDCCACCWVSLCQNVLFMYLYMFVCVHAWVNNYSNRCFVSFFSALLVAPWKQNTYLCNCTQGAQICLGTHSHTKTGALHFNFLDVQIVW